VNKTRLTLASLALTVVLAAGPTTGAAPRPSVTPSAADVTGLAQDRKFARPK
jgi:hypothetical protein